MNTSWKTPPDIALVTASQMPKPDLDSPPLIEALKGLGIEAMMVPWDAEVRWEAIPLVVLRSPWDYTRRFDSFMEWASRISRDGRLHNPYPLVCWNGHKSYLLDLAAKGVPVVPTTLIRAGEPNALERLSALSGASEIVIKPAIGAGASDAMKARKEDPALAHHLAEILRTKDALVQPFVSAISEAGEVSLIYFDGQYSHAVRKVPATGDFRVQERHGGALHAHEPTPAGLAVGSAALAAAPTPSAYARVDLVEFEGSPVIMELELIEPELFLRRSPEGLQRFAQVLKSTLEG